MSLFENLTDDQLALLGCLAALLFAGTVMSLSYYIGRARNAKQTRVDKPELLRMPHRPERYRQAPTERRAA